MTLHRQLLPYSLGNDCPLDLPDRFSLFLGVVVSADLGPWTQHGLEDAFCLSVARWDAGPA